MEQHRDMRTTKTSATGASAAQMIAELLVRIPERCLGAKAWRRNVGAGVGESILRQLRADLNAGRIQSALGLLNRRNVKYGVEGEPDIAGILPVNGYGIWLGVEVKAPGDKMSEDQILFQRVITTAGGIYLECRNVEETLKVLERFQRGPDVEGRMLRIPPQREMGNIMTYERAIDLFARYGGVSSEIKRLTETCPTEQQMDSAVDRAGHYLPPKTVQEAQDAIEAHWKEPCAKIETDKLPDTVTCLECGSPVKFGSPCTSCWFS